MYLTCRDANGVVHSFDLAKRAMQKPLRIGRGNQVDIVLRDEKCSRIHCSVLNWDELYILRDMGSRNGTQVNGHEIDFEVIKPGDVIQVGGTQLTAAASLEP